MIHDYVASGTKDAPLHFAEEYYRHLPKIAFGIWPPLFHVLEAVWMLLFSASKASAVVMLGLIAATLAFLLFQTVERHFGYWTGILSGLLLISIPLMQKSTALIMVDSTVALFSFLAVLRFARYLDSGRWQDAALFGVWSSAAILSKYNGAALALVPVLSIVISRRWDLLWRGRTWLPAGIVAVLCGPWYIAMWRMLAYAAEPEPSMGTVLPVAKAYAALFLGMVGAPILIVACVGIVSSLRAARDPSARPAGIWVASAASVAGCWIFHSLATPTPDNRYLLPALPWLILFLAAGAATISRWIGRRPVEVTAVVIALYLVGNFTLFRSPRPGYGEIAEAVTRSLDGKAGTVMVDGSAEAEGMIVSEIAIRDRARRLYVFRGSKLLATSTWMREQYRARYNSPEAMHAALTRAGVAFVVLETATPQAPHRRMLLEALESQTGIWEPWDEQAWRNKSFVRVYRRTRAPAHVACVEVSLEHTFHGKLNICPQPDPPSSASASPPVP